MGHHTYRPVPRVTRPRQHYPKTEKGDRISPVAPIRTNIIRPGFVSLRSSLNADVASPEGAQPSLLVSIVLLFETHSHSNDINCLNVRNI